MDNGSLDLGALLNFAASNPELLKTVSSLFSGGKGSPWQNENSRYDTGFGGYGAGGFSGKNERKPENQGIFTDPEENRKRIALLNAVRPYLSEKRREMMDIVVKIMKLSELGGLSSLLGKL